MIKQELKLQSTINVRIPLLAIGLLWGIFLTCGESYFASTIFLKNGKQVLADRVWSEGGQICYETDGNLYRFAKSLVLRVEEGEPILNPASQPFASPEADTLTTAELGKLPEKMTLVNPEAIPKTTGVIKDGKIDSRLLLEFETAARSNRGDAQISQRYQMALSEVIHLQVQQGNQPAALESLQRFLSFDPGNLQASLILASLYLKQGQYAQVENLLSPLELKHRNSAELCYLLGTAYSLQEKNEFASRALRRSLELQYNPDVQKALKKIEGENQAENSFRQSNSLHFVVRYEGTDSYHALGREILESLEKAFRDLEIALNYSPRETIAVVLYPDELFQDVTQAPHWAGALNDGKIRIPIKGISRVDGQLERILKHELTHSFVRLKTGSNCPVWLNEGLAQFLSGDSAKSYTPILRQLAEINQLPPLAQLEGAFVSLPTPAMLLAYHESLLAVEFLNQAYGMETLLRILSESANNASFESTLKTVLRRDYSELQKEFHQYLGLP
jgi:tetratricopeptide (TPR) repeat protein